MKNVQAVWRWLNIFIYITFKYHYLYLSVYRNIIIFRSPCLIFCRSKDRQIAHIEIKSETVAPLGYVDTRTFQEPTGARDANTDLIEKVFLARQDISDSLQICFIWSYKALMSWKLLFNLSYNRMLCLYLKCLQGGSWMNFLHKKFFWDPPFKHFFC